MERYKYLKEPKHPEIAKKDGDRMNKAKKKQKHVIQRYLVSMRGCEACGDAKRKLKAKIMSGKIKIVTPYDHKGVEILQALNLWEVPVLAQELDDGTFKREW